MKKNTSKRILATFLAFLMVFLMIPFSALNIFAVEEESEENHIDYTPFIIESVNGKAVYNAQTADLTYDFYKAAKSYVDHNASSTIKQVEDGAFSFSHNGITYVLESVYINKPTGFWDSTCGMLIGVLNYVWNNETKHVMMVMFEGTKGKWDVFTDLSFASEKVDSNHYYHNGFYEAAHNHYDILSEQIFSLGDEEVTLLEYIDKLKDNANNCQMIITGHSLGAATANIFTSYFVDTLGGMDVQKNVIAYTFATPLTCSDRTANNSNVGNVFNFINKWDWVPKVGYGGAEALDLGTREGVDIKYTAGSSDWKDKQPIFGKKFLNFTNHKMSSTVYGAILEKANDSIYEKNPHGTFVLYNNYDEVEHTYQRIVFNNGQLIVSGNGVLVGNWYENALVEWAKVRDKCTSLVFAPDCAIVEIGDYAFAGMTQITDRLELPKSVIRIGNYAFFHCGIEGELVIPENVREVGVNAFNGCSDLDRIDAKAAINMVWQYGAFANCVHKDDLHLPIEDKGTDLKRDIFSVYYVEDVNGIHRVPIQDATSDNIILPGDKIFYGRLLDEQIVDRPYFDFHYLLTEGNVDNDQSIMAQAKQFIEGVASIDEFGCVTVDPECETGKEFTVIVLFDLKGGPDYNARESQYYIHYKVGEKNKNFAGGTGSEARPYLIQSVAQLKEITKYPKQYFKLIDNIDFCGETLSPLGVLSGGLDGDGYTISGFAMSVQSNAGLFTEVANDAYVKNLTIGATTNNAEYLTTISVGHNGKTELVVGGICATNNGMIENCTVSNVSISASRKVDWGSDSKLISIVGGIAGRNNNVITDCTVENSTIKAISKTHNDTNPAQCYAYSAGLVAVNAGTVLSCSSITNTTHSETYSKDKVGSEGKARSYTAGLIAKNDNVIRDCFVYENSLSVSATGESKKEVSHEYYAITSGKESNCDIGNITMTNDISSIVLYKEPHKTKYYIGDPLVLFGLEIKDVNDNQISGYTVSGYDSKKSGQQAITVTYNTGYCDEPLTVEFNVMVENIVPQAVVVSPKAEQYKVNDTVSVNDFYATIYYNNGDVESIESLSQNSSKIVKFTEFSNLLDAKDTHVLELCYYYAYMTAEGVAAPSETMTIHIAVNANCDCSNTVTLNEVFATESDYGYTGDIVCEECSSIIEEGSVIDMIEQEGCETHNYESWISFDDTQHIHTCTVCGESVYEEHLWDVGRIISPATHTQSGEMVKICIECGEAVIEIIPPIEGHSYDEWSKYDEDEHVRVCECGEVEYEDHVWGIAQVTKPATHLATGELTKTCSVCSTEMIEEIAPITEHAFGKWFNYDENQHSRVCECGEIEYGEHDWDAGKVTVAPTFTTPGELTMTCATCGTTATKVLEPIPVQEDQPYIIVSSRNATVGEVVMVKISLQDNPGVTSVRINVAYDSNLLTLQSIVYNTEMGGQGMQPESYDNLNGNVTVYWTDGLSDYHGDGLFATLTFIVSDSAVAGQSTSIAVTYEEEDIYNANETNVTFICENSTLTFVEYTPGDVNGDGIMNSKDVTRLMRYLAGWDVEVNECALDINGDGVVNTKDTTRLMRYLAGWNVEIH